MCNQAQSSVKEDIQNQATSTVVVQKRVRRDKLWIIHGALYDLEEFVSRHPGGRETILLGQGRDCTALFESYHAFAKRHRQVLETYRFSKSQTAASIKEDYFYSVLKERAIAVLKGKGIIPVTHRGATPARAVYYGFIFCCCVTTGYWHLKVRLSWHVGIDRPDSNSATCSCLFSLFVAGHYCLSREVWWVPFRLRFSDGSWGL